MAGIFARDKPPMSEPLGDMNLRMMRLALSLPPRFRALVRFFRPVGGSLTVIWMRVMRSVITRMQKGSLARAASRRTCQSCSARIRAVSPPLAPCPLWISSFFKKRTFHFALRPLAPYQTMRLFDMRCVVYNFDFMKFGWRFEAVCYLRGFLGLDYQRIGGRR